MTYKSRSRFMNRDATVYVRRSFMGMVEPGSRSRTGTGSPRRAPPPLPHGLCRAQNDQSIVYGSILSVTANGGLDVSIMDCRCFCPPGQAKLYPAENLNQLIVSRTTDIFLVSTISENSVIVSRRAAHQYRRTQELLPLVGKATFVRGVISRRESWGVFVDLNGGLTGLIHVSELSETYATDARNFGNLGDAVMVRVLAVRKDEANRWRVALSLRSHGRSSPD